MSYVLDTDTCIYWLKGIQAVREHADAVGMDSLAVSIVTAAELYFGAYRSARVAENLARADAFLGHIAILPVSEAVAREFGRLKAETRKRGRPIADFDLLIASTALAEARILVTNNTRHYTDIPGLQLENWVSA